MFDQDRNKEAQESTTVSAEEVQHRMIWLGEKLQRKWCRGTTRVISHHRPGQRWEVKFGPRREEQIGEMHERRAAANSVINLYSS